MSTEKVHEHTGILSCLGLCVTDDLFADEVEVRVLDTGLVQKLAPLFRLFGLFAVLVFLCIY